MGAPQLPWGIAAQKKTMAVATICHGITYTTQACENSMHIMAYAYYMAMVPHGKIDAWVKWGMNGERATHS